jgi:hypothetical protein
MEFLRRRWPVLLLLLLPLIPLWKAVLLGEAIGPFDQIRQMGPWYEDPIDGRAWDVLQADGVLQFWMWRNLVLEGWASFDLPFWNPHQLMGTPLLANSQSGAFYPPHILLGVAQIPVKAALTILAFFHLAIAGLGVRALVKQLGGSEEGAVFGGAVFALSPLLISWTPLASVISVLAWLPWCLVAITWCIDSYSYRTALRGGSLVAVCTGMMILAGHLQFTAYGLMAMAVFGLILLILKWKNLILKWAIPAAILGVSIGPLLAAPQLLPVLDYSQYSHRKSEATEAGYKAYLGGSLNTFEAAGVAYPSVMGTPGQAAESEPGAPPTPAYWPAYVERGANFAEGALTIGPLALALLFLFRRKKQEVWAAVGVGFLGLLIAFGSPLNRLLYFNLPGWSSTGSPGRAICLFVLASAVLAGLLWPTEEKDKRPKMFALYGIGAGLILGVLMPLIMSGSLGSWLPGEEGAALVKSMVSQQVLGAGPMVLLIAVIVAAALMLAFKGKKVYALALGLLSQALIFAPSGLLTAPKAFERVQTEPQVRIAAVNGGWDLLSAAPAVYPPNTAASLGMYDVAGYDSLLHKDTVAILKTINRGQDPAPPANGNIMLIKPGFDAAALASVGVSKVVSSRPIDGIGAPIQAAPLYEYEIETEGRAFTEAGPVEIMVDGLSEQVLLAKGPATLTVRDRNMPGWSAEVDGTPVEIKEGEFRVIEMTNQGPQIVKFTYTPPGLKKGLQLFGIGFLLLVTASIIARVLRGQPFLDSEA